MAQEPERGCGFRKVNGLYLVGSYLAISCDRLPFPLKTCRTCGAGTHFTRAMTEIIPSRLFGLHDNCADKLRPCFVCDPVKKPAYLMMVGEKFYPSINHFLKEAEKFGISKRVPFIPKNLKIGEPVIYLAHNKACIEKKPIDDQPSLPLGNEVQTRMIDAKEKQIKAFGIFAAFIPQRIEMPVWKSALTKKKRAELEKRGITPVPLKDGDKDHK